MIAPMNQSNERLTRTKALKIANRHLASERSADGLADKVTSTVGHYPVIAVAAATVLGIAAGWIIKRKL